jgi:hypothetical protein
MRRRGCPRPDASSERQTRARALGSSAARGEDVQVGVPPAVQRWAAGGGRSDSGQLGHVRRQALERHHPRMSVAASQRRSASVVEEESRQEGIGWPGLDLC